MAMFNSYVKLPEGIVFIFVLRLWFQQRRGWGHRVSKPAASGVLVREARRERRDVLPLFCTCMYIYYNIIFIWIYIYIWLYIHIYTSIHTVSYSIHTFAHSTCLLFCTMLWVWKWWFSRLAGLATSTFHHLFDPPVITRWSFGLARTSDQKGNPHAPGELQICCGQSEFQLSLGPGR